MRSLCRGSPGIRNLLTSFMQSSTSLTLFPFGYYWESGRLFPLALYGQNSSPVTELTTNLPKALKDTFYVAIAHSFNYPRQCLTKSSESVIGIEATPNTGRLRLQQSLISTRSLESFQALYWCVLGLCICCSDIWVGFA